MRENERSYHHGDLKTALLTEAEKILERDGIQALTLRAAARAAGVSHAAPANHFGDLTGLLSELAAVGFNRFAADLTAARDTGHDADSRATATGKAYVRFARARPGLFLLMFRSERLDPTRPALRDALATARQTLRAADGTGNPLPPLASAALGAARWSLVHGYAMLLLDGRLDSMIEALPGGQSQETLLDAVLAATRIAS